MSKRKFSADVANKAIGEFASRQQSSPSSEEKAALIALFNQGRYTATALHAQQMTKDYPLHGFGWKSLGAALRSLGQSVDALAAMKKAATLSVSDVEVHTNLGVIYQDLDRSDEAESCHRLAIQIKPDYGRAHFHLANSLREQGRLGEAEGCYRRTLQITPDHAEAQGNLGGILLDLGRLTEAEAFYRQAIQVKPDYAEAHCDLGNTVKKLGRVSDAEACYRQALRIKPAFAAARLNLGFLLLALGRYAEAWPYHESRYDPAMKGLICETPPLPYPQWQGEPLIGKSLLIWPEQGFGDYIHFVRYAGLLKQLGLSRLTLLSTPPLTALLETVAGVDAVVTDAASLQDHDYWSFPLSLPLHLATTVETIPCALPYLHALPARIDRWRNRLPKRGFKVGLIWKGRPTHKNDANRSLPGLTSLAPLWSVPGVVFVSLQKGPGEEEAQRLPAELPIISLGADINDFADTAAIVAQLDLVICVDTALAHLAGALGKPCWVLLPAYQVDWRWLFDRTDSPWYPGALQLFRQTAEGDWDSVMASVAEALQQYVTC